MNTIQKILAGMTISGLVALAAITAFAQTDPAAVSASVIQWDAVSTKPDRSDGHTNKSRTIAAHPTHATSGF